MPFGQSLPLEQDGDTADGSEIEIELSARSPAERHKAVAERMTELLGQARRITGSIRDEHALTVQGIAEDLDADAAPLMLKGMREHFTVVRDGETVFPFYCHISADRMDQVWPNAQFEMHGLMRRMQDFNLYCQAAIRNDALSMALHAPGTAERVDRIVTGIAHFMGYFENLAETQPFFDGRRAAERGSIDYDMLKATLDRSKLMAIDIMIEPQRLDDYWPDLPWPHVGVEILRKAESGQRHIQHIYFPAVFAREIVTRMEMEARETLEDAA